MALMLGLHYQPTIGLVLMLESFENMLESLLCNAFLKIRYVS
jgi:hypothetical protein